jgi:hypothetical protein
VDALDLEISKDGFTLWVRLGGLAEALSARLERLHAQLGAVTVLQGPDEQQLWRLVREFAWVEAGWSLVKVPLTPGRIPALEKALDGKAVQRRYIAGGQAVWLAVDGPPKNLVGLLETHGLSGLALFGPPGTPRLGDFTGRTFYKRVKDALDPAGRFVEV